MQPRPIAETSGPLRPSRRLAIWNMVLLPFCQPPKSSPTQSPACFARLKWGRHPLVTTGLPRNNRHFGTADPKRLGEQLHDRLIGRAVSRCLGDPDLKLLATVGALAPAADPRFGGARRDANPKDL